MEEFALLGNAAAVPIIIGATQLLKKNFSFRYKADVVSFVVALVVCPGWWFWHTPALEIVAAVDGGFIEISKFIMHMSLVSGATWLSATKLYDLSSGNKKRISRNATEKQVLVDKHTSEKEDLSVRIQELELVLENGGDNEPEENNKISNQLLDILEGRD